MWICESLGLSGNLRGEFPSGSRAGTVESSVLSTRHRVPAVSDPAAVPGPLPVGQGFSIPATPPGRCWILRAASPLKSSEEKTPQVVWQHFAKPGEEQGRSRAAGGAHLALAEMCR